MQYLVFSLENQEIALPLTLVERVIWAVAVNEVPNISNNVSGVINIHGDIIPVINLRKLLIIREKELSTADQFIVCHLSSGYIALWVDMVKGMEEYEQEELIPGNTVFPDTPLIEHIIQKGSHVTLLYNWDKLLSYESTEARDSRASVGAI